MLTVCILLNRLKFRHDVLKMPRKILQRNCLNVFETGEVKEANSNLIFSSTFEGVLLSSIVSVQEVCTLMKLLRGRDYPLNPKEPYYLQGKLHSIVFRPIISLKLLILYRKTISVISSNNVCYLQNSSENIVGIINLFSQNTLIFCWYQIGWLRNRKMPN